MLQGVPNNGLGALYMKLLATTKENEKPLAPLQQQHEEARSMRPHYRALVRVFRPNLDPFQIEDVIDYYEHHPGGMAEMTATLETAFKVQSITASSGEVKASASAKSTEISPRAFWVGRITEYYQAKKISVSAEAVRNIVDEIVVFDTPRAWGRLLQQHGPEAEENVGRWQHFRHYWRAEMLLFASARGVSISPQEVDQMLDGCQQRWGVALRNLEERYGVAMDPMCMEAQTGEVVGTAAKTTHNFKLSDSQRGRWFTKIMNFYRHYAPEKANVAHVEHVLSRAESMRGGWESLWALLQVKHGPPPPECLDNDDAESEEETQVRDTPKKDEVSTPQPENTLRGLREYWREKIIAYCDAKQLRKTELEVDVALDKYANKPGGYEQLWADLTEQYGYAIVCPAVHGPEFWRWRIARFLRERSLAPSQHAVGYDDSAPTLAQAFCHLEQLYGRERQSTTEAFHSFVKECATPRQVLKGKGGEDLASVRNVQFGTPDYWVRRMEEHRSRHAPHIKRDLVETLVATGEAVGTPFEKIFLHFVTLCSQLRQKPVATSTSK